MGGWSRVEVVVTTGTSASRKTGEGLDIKERGRVPADVIAKFRAATGN